jgi:26S proteasome regulatory subunit N3
MPRAYHLLLELEIYIATLLLTSLLREHLDETAALFSSCLIERVKSFNRRSMDILSSKVFFYFALAYEKLNKLEIIRSTLLGLYRTSCLHRDEIGQAVLLNLVLRNYLHYNLFDQAQNFASKAPFPVDISNNQYCRYLYYMGRIQAVQLEYSEASIRLTQALRKAPTSAAHGFLPEVQKLAIIVQLLMGDIPERSVFNQPETKHVLTPYLKLTQAVRNGNMPQFNEVVAAYSGQFKQDDTYTLVQRLGHNVLKIGLRKISIAYSRISFADIAAKLHLSSAGAAEYICSKAIRDGVIDATIDHEQGWVCSNDILDVYSTQQPMKEFHRRIAFCLDSHNEAIKAMRYPPDAYKKEHMKSTGQKDGGEKSIDEIIKEMEV